MFRVLFSCHGRIGRPAMLLILPISLMLAAVGAVIWYSQFQDLKAAIDDLGWEALLPTLLDPTPHLIATIAILALFLLWWSIARSLMVKRLHDRERSGAWVLLLILSAVAFVTLVFIPEASGAAQAAEGAVAALAIGFVLWLLRELFFMPGTSGDNRFGPEPRRIDRPSGPA